MRSYSVRFAASDLFAELLKEEGLFAAFYSVCHLHMYIVQTKRKLGYLCNCLTPTYSLSQQVGISTK